MALAKEQDWLKERAEVLLAEHRGSIWTGLPTFIEIAYNAHECEIDLERAAVSILELADVMQTTAVSTRQRRTVAPTPATGPRRCAP